MLFKKTQTDSLLIYNHSPISKKTAFIILSPAILVLIAWLSNSATLIAIALIGITVWIGAVALIFCLYSTPFMIQYYSASLKGKRITKSGNWWTGNLRYEIEK